MQNRHDVADLHGRLVIFFDFIMQISHHMAELHGKMMENKRTIAAKISEMHEVFPCVMVTGARQVGKSTLLKSLLPEGMQYVTFDDELMLIRAKEDPVVFLAEGKGSYAYPISMI